MTFSFPFLQPKILECLGDSCSSCLCYLKYQQSISRAYQQEPRRIFYERLQSKHWRPTARLGFEILTLLYDGTSVFELTFTHFQYCRVILILFFWRTHVVKFSKPSEQCNHSFKFLSGKMVFYNLRRAVSSISATEKGKAFRWLQPGRDQTLLLVFWYSLILQ